MTKAQANVILSKKSLDESEDLLTCGICKEIFTDPKQLPCVHCFCKHCLELMTNDTDRSSLRCPVCRREFTIPDNSVASFEDNEYLRNLSELLNAKKEEDTNKHLECSICKESKSPEHISHCLECDDNLCNKCEEYHKKFEKLTRGHTVVAYKDLICPDGILNRCKASCEEHTNKMLELFCFTCRECMCLECLNSHLKRSENDCDITTLPVPRETLMDTWNDQVHCLEEIIHVYEQEITDSNRVQQSIRESTEKIREEIQAESDRLIAAVKVNTNTLLERLDQTSKTDEKVINLHRDKAETIIQACKHMLKFREHLMKNGKDIEVIPAMPALEERLKYFKKPVDYLNIEGMFRFVTANNTEVGKLQRMSNVLETWEALSELQSGSRVRRGKGWQPRGNDYHYQTGTIVLKQSGRDLSARSGSGIFGQSSGGLFGPCRSPFGSQTRQNIIFEVSWDGKLTERTTLNIDSQEANFQIAPLSKCWYDIVGL